MRRFRLSAPSLALLLFLLLPVAAYAQDASDRGTRIARNLKFRFEQLKDATLTVTEVSDSGIPGIDIGTLVINGQQQLRFLVTNDDTRLYLLAADAVDVSMDDEALAKSAADLDRRKAAEAQQRHRQLLALSQEAPSLGPADAPVTIFEFSDFQCPFCAQAAPTVKQLLQKYPEQVRLVYIDLPLDIHPWARKASIMAGCAARQSSAAFWGLHDFYFGNQRSIDPQNVDDRSRAALAGAGIDLAAWESCAGDTDSDAHIEVAARLQGSMMAAQGLGVGGTPYFFINGWPLNGAKPLADFVELVDQALGSR